MDYLSDHVRVYQWPQMRRSLQIGSLLLAASACRPPTVAQEATRGEPTGEKPGAKTGEQRGGQPVAGSAGAGAPAVTGAEELDGVYLQSHEVMVYAGDDWEPSEVDDCLSVQRMGENQLRFEIQLIATNAHLCVLDGVASRVRGPGEVYEFRPGTEEDSCRLQLNVTEEAIQLVDVDFGCRMQFCGARAGLDGASFDRVNRTRSDEGCID